MNIYIFGEGSVGKSTYIKFLRFGTQTKRWKKTLGAEVHKINVPTNKGGQIIQLMDFAGQKEWLGDPLVYINLLAESDLGVDGILLFFAMNNKESYTKIEERYEYLKDYITEHNIPVVLVGTKTDTRGKMDDSEITLHREYNLPFCKISTKKEENLYTPIELLM